MVYYRKYRPQRISELDSASVRGKLAALLAAKELPHAFLFTGTRGLGKTSTARIIAKVLNCEHLTKDGESCNQCDTCVSITDGSNLDVLEIDAASNRGIDEIRSLREKIKLAPVVAKKKVYIIDEVHMLTNEAFNALLKTLEEPPSHALFVLCTTELQKVPETIQSRCFHVTFTRPSIAEIEQSIMSVAQSEEIPLSEPVARKLAKAADGSFRDAKKLLEQVVLEANGGELTEALVERCVGSSTKTGAFLEALLAKNLQQSLQIVQESVDAGTAMKPWLEELVTELHAALLANYGRSTDGIAEVLANTTEAEVKTLLTLLSEAHQQTRGAVLPQLPLELAIVAYCTEKH